MFVLNLFLRKLGYTMKLRKLIAICALTAFSFGIYGCGEKKADDQPAKDDAKKTETVAPDKAKEEAAPAEKAPEATEATEATEKAPEATEEAPAKEENKEEAAH